MTETLAHVQSGGDGSLDYWRTVGDGRLTLEGEQLATIEAIRADIQDVWDAAYDRDPMSDLTTYCGIASQRLGALVTAREYKRGGAYPLAWR